MSVRATRRRAAVGAVVGSAAVVVITLAGVLPAAPVAEAASLPLITGSGSTWSANAIFVWQADVSKLGIKVNYQQNGSGAGRTAFLDKTVDFGVSEIPFQPPPEDPPTTARPNFQYLPIVAGGTSLMYNLRDAAGNAVRDLKLSANAIAKIFTGQISSWNDPAIQADNPGRTFETFQITPIIRSDNSGTSAQFSRYLGSQAAPIWMPFYQSFGLTRSDGQTSSFPAFGPRAKAQLGSDGVANFIASDATGRGSIGYVEYSYAQQRRRPVASVLNVSGAYTQPAAGNVAVALTKVRINPDRTQILDGVYTNPDPRVYPISSYSYMIVPLDLPPDKGAALSQFIEYFACTGQRKMANLGYSPLPPNLVQFAADVVALIPGGTPFPPLTAAGCPNPYITGDFSGSGTGGSGGTGGTGGSGGTGGTGGTGGSGGAGGGSGSGSGAGSGTGTGTGGGSGGARGSTGVAGGAGTGTGGSTVTTIAPSDASTTTIDPTATDGSGTGGDGGTGTGPRGTDSSATSPSDGQGTAKGAVTRARQVALASTAQLKTAEPPIMPFVVASGVAIVALLVVPSVLLLWPRRRRGA